MDYSIIELGQGRKVRIKGKIRKKYNPQDHNVKPLRDRYTVTLVSGKPQLTYLLKFREETELDQFVEGENVIVEGVLKLIDGKKVLLNVKLVSDAPVESL